jgi:hypothetical protein
MPVDSQRNVGSTRGRSRTLLVESRGARPFTEEQVCQRERRTHPRRSNQASASYPEQDHCQ